MVLEDLRRNSDEIIIDQREISENNNWIITGIKNMPLNYVYDDNNSRSVAAKISRTDSARNGANLFFFRNLVGELCDMAVDRAEGATVLTRDKVSVEQRNNRANNRKTSIVIVEDLEPLPVECRNNFVNASVLKRSVSERVISVNRAPDILDFSEKKTKEKRKKKLSFNNLFHKKERHKNKDAKFEEDAETYDTFSHQLPEFNGGTLGKSKKYASALELSQKSSSKLQKTHSFIKKIVHMGEDSSNFLKRSLSFREVRKKEKVPSREKLTEIKNQEWRQSLQSLVESDNCVSYNDLSFIDYDALNQFNYTEPVFLKPGFTDGNQYIGRSQSLREKRSLHPVRNFQRHTSVTPECRFSLGSNSSISKEPSTVSLPSLRHESKENEEKLSGSCSASICRRGRPPSFNADDSPTTGNVYVNDGVGGGVGYNKLRRHNACRQKVRHPTTYIEPRQRTDESDRAADLLKKEKSEEKDKRKADKQPLAKQKSIGLEATSSTKSDYIRALSFRDKTKSVSAKHDESSLSAPKLGEKSVRKSEKKDIRHSLSFSRCRPSSSSPKGKEGIKQDDFLKATMRIFLVVSPPVGKLQVRSRSLNHLDSLEMRQAVVSTAEAALKDSKSEPDCTRPLLPPPATASSVLPSASGLPHGGREPQDAGGTAHVDLPPARKHMLSRSQKSSSECFSVNFEVGDESTWDNELFFPAQRGVTLHDSLSKLCELRSIDLSTCDARLQDKENNSESYILFTQDTASLVGRHVRITAKDSSNKKYSGSLSSNHSRKQSASYRPRTSSFFNSSTEEQNTVSSTLSLHEGDQSKRQIKQRLTAFFGNSKDTKYEVVIDQLDRYSKQGIPQNVNYPQGQCESVDALYKLEEDWRDIITDYGELNDKQQQQQTALWELIKTEVAYIKTLKVVTDLFLGCLRDLQSKNLFKEIDTEKLFSNITEILDANVVFWRNTLFPLVRDMRKYKRPACLENMLEGFSKIHDTFQPYYKYCAEQSRCQHYCRENLESEVFTAYLTWCESQKDCNRLRLMDILVQPMQRLTKYGLLLKAILKNTDEDVEREGLQTMIKMVDEFVNNVNSSLKHRQDKERLKGIIARIESYDIVESKDDDIDRILKKEKSFTQLDLTRPMLGCPQERKRHLLLEGDLKLKDSGTSKVEVHCFLLTDMLLICKPSTKKGGATMRVIRQPYLVDKLVVTELNKETPSLAVIYRNEFEMAVAAFILQSNDAKKTKGWKDGIAKAQYLYAQAKQMSYITDESLDADYNLEYNIENDFHSLQLAPKSPLASSSRASRVSSLAHSHSGSVEMNDQTSIGSIKDQSKVVSMETENRTGSISSDEGVQSLPADKSPVSQKNALKNRLFHKTPNTLSVQPYGSLGQSLPNLTLHSPSVGSGLSLSLNQNTLSVPSSKNGSHLLSPTHRGISYPPPSPTRGNLRRSLAISQSKNPPLIKTRQVNSASSVSSSHLPASFDFDVPVIAGVQTEENCESFSRGHHRQAMKRNHRYHTAGIVDEIKKNDNKDPNIYKRLSWNCTNQEQRPPNEDHT